MTTNFPARLMYDGWFLLMGVQGYMLLRAAGYTAPDAPLPTQLLLEGMAQIVAESLPDGMGLRLLLIEEQS